VRPYGAQTMDLHQQMLRASRQRLKYVYSSPRVSNKYTSSERPYY